MGLGDWVRLFLISLVWGSAFFLIEITLRDTGPLTLVLGRLSVAAIIVMVYCWASGIRVKFPAKRIAAFGVMGLLGTVIPFSLIALGQTRITSSLTAILIASAPLFTVLTGHFWRRVEPAAPTKFLGVIIGFTGVSILMGPEVLRSLGADALAQLSVLGAALSYAVSAVFGRRFRELPPAASAAGMLVAGSLMMVPLAFFFEAPLAHTPSIATTACILSLGILSTALAYILYFTILANAGATNAMLVTIVQPPLAILLGAALLGETLEPNQMFGLLFILAGLLLVDGHIVRYALGRP